MPNVTGVNGYTPPANDVPYGDAEVNAAVQKSAPLAGAQETAHATNAPRREQRQAVRGDATEAPVGPPPQMPGQPGQIAPQAQVAAFWAAVAQQPGASDLVKQIAQEANSGSTNLPAA